MLRVTLAINAEQIADYEVRRVTGVEGRPLHDDVNEYDVRRISAGSTGPVVGTVLHQYGDGAHELAATVLRMVDAS